MSKMLYISKENRKAGYTPENGYDPRYYDLSYDDEIGEQPNDGIMRRLDDACGENSYSFMSYMDVIYTENFNVMRIMQDEFGISPLWFDVVDGDIDVAEELENDGWRW